MFIDRVRYRGRRGAYFLTEESSRAPSTWVTAGGESGSALRQAESRDRLPDGSLTTTRDRRPSEMMVERGLLELTSLGTSQTGPADTVLGRTVVPGGQAGGFP
jgi:hypothetical protein